MDRIRDLSDSCVTSGPAEHPTGVSEVPNPIHEAQTDVKTELKSCVNVEVAVLGSPSLITYLDGFCGRKATLNLNSETCGNSGAM